MIRIKNIQAQFLFLPAIVMMSCQSDNKDQPEAKSNPVQLVTLDPGHFHAALVQKSMYGDIDSVVYVYAPEGKDLKLHLDRINVYNSRAESPTIWKEVVYTGNDFFEKMIAEKKGNVVMLSGNNQKKTDYILQSLQKGFNVFADKPMVIDTKGFDKLKQAFDVASNNNVLLYDIMTERFEINTILQRELSMIPGIFGELEKGTADSPAITKESVHHFYKYVSGSILTRPAWFVDVSQQGEGIVDVMTHLVDLVQWECFPNQTIDYTKDIAIGKVRRWTTDLKLSEFKAITKVDSFPPYFANNIIKDSILQVYCNGEINYQLRGVHARTSVTWNYKAPEGTGDTHYSIMRGTKSELIIKQGKEEGYKPTLYIYPRTNTDYNPIESFKKIQSKYPGTELKEITGIMAESGQSGFSIWKVVIPDKYNEGHESHFARVTNNFLDYLKNKNMPAWEVPNMLAKYYTTTRALEVALKTK